jgi:transposase
MSTLTPTRKPSPRDVSDDEGECVVPSLTLLAPDALQRRYALREVFHAVRWLAHTGAPWRSLPGDFPPWPAVSQQARRWMEASRCEALVHDLRQLLRVLHSRQPPPSAALLDGRVRPSSPESGARAGDSGAKRRNGSKVQAAVDPLGHRLALRVTAASADERTQVAALAQAIQAVTGEHVEVAFVDQGDSGAEGAATAAEQGLRLVVVKLEQAKRGFVLRPKRWISERGFAWTARFRRLARDDARLPSVRAGLHFLVFACLMLHQLIHLYSSP